MLLGKITKTSQIVYKPSIMYVTPLPVFPV